MTRLLDHFAMLLVVTTPYATNRDELERLLRPSQDRFELRLSVHPIETEREMATSRGAPWLVTVSGPDQTGIVHSVTSFLAARNVNVGSLSSKRLPGDDDKPVFLMTLEAEVPEAAANGLPEGLEELGRREGLTIHAEALDEYRL